MRCITDCIVNTLKTGRSVPDEPPVPDYTASSPNSIPTKDLCIRSLIPAQLELINTDARIESSAQPPPPLPGIHLYTIPSTLSQEPP